MAIYPGPPPGHPPRRGKGIKGKGLPFDSTTTLFNFALDGALEEEGPGKGTGDDEETTETTTRTEKPLTHADRVGGFVVSMICLDFLNSPSGEHKIVPVNITSPW